VLILPPGHASELAGVRRSLTGRERWILRGAGAAVVAIVVALVVSFATSSPRSAHGCVHVTVASSMGAQPVDGCGAKARALCAQPDAYAGLLRSELRLACRQAGLAAARP
jgi:hypothetical protein